MLEEIVFGTTTRFGETADDGNELVVFLDFIAVPGDYLSVSEFLDVLNPTTIFFYFLQLSNIRYLC